MAVVACFAAMSMNAQSDKPESKTEKMLRLTKAADENPKDWKAQFEAGHFLIEKDNEMYNPAQAEKYYERLFHLAMDYNKAIPDSVIRETGFMLAAMSQYPGKEDLDRGLFYIDAMRHADKMGVDMSEGYTYLFEMFGMSFSKGMDEKERSLYYMTELRNHLAKDKKPGIEYTDVMTAMLYDDLMLKYKEMYGDKLLKLTLDGKKYIALAMGDWNIERPLTGWTKKTEEDQESLYYCCDDGKIYDELHGEMTFAFYADKDGVKPQDGANARLVTVTPEQRQEMVKAYHKYMMKAKKNK